MKIENQVTSLDLSKRLKELGFKQESLFYWNQFSNTPLGKEDYKISQFKLLEAKEIYSAYTVAELGEMLPRTIKLENGEAGILQTLKDSVGSYDVCYMGQSDFRSEYGNTEADARAKMLIYLKENNLI